MNFLEVPFIFSLPPFIFSFPSLVNLSTIPDQKERLRIFLLFPIEWRLFQNSVIFGRASFGFIYLPADLAGAGIYP